MQLDLLCDLYIWQRLIKAEQRDVLILNTNLQLSIKMQMGRRAVIEKVNIIVQLSSLHLREIEVCPTRGGPINGTDGRQFVSAWEKDDSVRVYRGNQR